MNQQDDFAQRQRPVILCILDGWGLREDAPDNAISMAKTPVWDRLLETCPVARLQASAEEVGLPAGQMGNSEVGHMNIGAGRVVMQDLPLIDTAIADGSLKANPELRRMIDALKKSGGTCHIMGLLSPGGVHSMQGHMAALARIVTESGVPVRIHAFLDGRDTPPSSAKKYMGDFLSEIDGLRNCRIATVGGRYYAMDRDNRWERVAKAYRSIVIGAGEKAPNPMAAIDASYNAETTDEFVLPTVINGYEGMANGDGILMANFRADRAREILSALLDPGFDGFERPRTITFETALGMVEYSAEHSKLMGVLFPSVELTGILGQVLSDAGLKQLRIAETEKYAHVTFFFNGGEEKVFPGEDRILVPSPKIATYDLQPSMSAPEVTDKLVAAIGSGKYDVIIVNYANGDMVGHTGFIDAAVKAAETVDTAIGRLDEAVKLAGGVMLITADHGNLEQMSDPESGQQHTAHTLNPVPLVMVNGPSWAGGLNDGRLADIAPTILRLMGMKQPSEMTGRSLIDEGTRRDSA
ncbi:MAG: 2,3-bisphosphoglycerate-independent phosphoglycerate mutase [Rhodospirillales bacterium]|nr:2,3-bisphosphoglycerate-independent phosphoglycerate mutase [Rhodospirillales bacterium]